ncbi:MAG TPA: hypothetical protein PK299_08260 [Anaerolineales bacterium]|nr:hypothetical protein [Anaerolineales bacterium]
MKRWQIFLWVCILLFVTLLAYWIVAKLSATALAVLLGVLAGSIASVPASLLTAWLYLRHLQPSKASQPVVTPPNSAERVVIITPPYVSPQSPAPDIWNNHPTYRDFNPTATTESRPKATILGE